MTQARDSVDILVVEDDPVTAKLIAVVLEKAGHVVRVAGSVAEARNAVYDSPPQLIISDVNLPDGEGFDLLHTIRQDALLPFIPAIVVSARDATSDVLRGLAWAEDYIRKPIDPSELRARVASTTRIKYLHDQVVDLNATLAAKVEERTRQLAEANLQLAEENEERRRTEVAVRTLSGRILDIQEEERARFARDIHDALGSSLLTLKLLIQTAFRDMDPEGRHAQDREQIVRLVDTVAAEARGIAHALSPLSLVSLGLVAALRELVTRARHISPHVNIVLAPTEGLQGYPTAWSQELYRLMQEALANSLRHSGAARIEVGLEAGDSGVRAFVRDNGSGFDPECPPNGIGILLMRERAQRLGGLLTISSTSGAGTEVLFEHSGERPREDRLRQADA